MSNKTIDQYLIQDPSVVLPDPKNPDDRDDLEDKKGYNRNLLSYYKKSIAIKNIWEFICQINVQVAVRKRLIKN